MTAAVVNTSSATAVANPSTDGITWAHTVTTGLNRKLVVSIILDEDTSSVGGPPDTITYGGIAMTPSIAADDSGDLGNYTFYLDNPPVGTAAIVATFSFINVPGVRLGGMAATLIGAAAGDVSAWLDTGYLPDPTFAQALAVPANNSLVLVFVGGQQAAGKSILLALPVTQMVLVAAGANNDSLAAGVLAVPVAGNVIIAFASSDGAAFAPSAYLIAVVFASAPAATVTRHGLKRLMADDLADTFIAVDDFAETGTYYPEGAVTGFAIALAVGDTADQILQYGGGQADQRQVAATGSLDVLRDGIATITGAARDPHHGDRWVVADGAYAGTWIVTQAEGDAGGGCQFMLRREIRHQGAAGGLAEVR